MTCRNRVMSALRRETPDRVPFVDIGADASVVAVALGRSLAEGSLVPLELEREFSRFVGRDNISSMHLGPPFAATYAHASDGRRYYVDGLVRTRDDLRKVSLPDPSMDELYEESAAFADGKEEFAACAIIGMGCDAVIQSMGLERLCIALYDDLGLVEDLLDIYTDWYATACARICELGFDFLWVADDIAYKSAPFFSPDVFREVFAPRLAKVARAISLPWIFHSDGNLLPVMDDVLSLGMDGLHPFEPGAMDIVQCKRDYGDRVCVVGNVSVDMLTRGTPEDIDCEVGHLIANLSSGGGYMVSSSNVFARGCKVENIVAMGQAIRRYGGYLSRSDATCLASAR